MEAIEYRELTPDLRAALQGTEADPWEMSDVTLLFRSKDQYLGLRTAEGRLVAAAGLVLAEVQVGSGGPIPIVGIGAVIVNHEFRGRGLGREIIEHSLRRAATLGPQIAVLFCRRDRAELYRRHGFAEVPPPVRVGQPGGVAEMPLVTMWRPLRDGATLPPGPMTLLGLPF